MVFFSLKKIQTDFKTKILGSKRGNWIWKLKAEYGCNPNKYMYNIATHLKIAKQLLTTAFCTYYTLDPGSAIDVFTQTGTI